MSDVHTHVRVGRGACVHIIIAPGCLVVCICAHMCVSCVFLCVHAYVCPHVHARVCAHASGRRGMVTCVH